MWKNIPRKVADINQSSRIPSSATIVRDRSDPEAKNCIIDFGKYLPSKCGICEIEEKAPGKKALEILRDIWLWSPKDINPYDTVKNWSKYAFLYKWLSKDTQILELKISQTGRIFYFLAQWVFYVRCIKGKHVDNY